MDAMVGQLCVADDTITYRRDGALLLAPMAVQVSSMNLHGQWATIGDS